ncbi:Csu type fimbrial protein [Ramlibacter humi]|uniref:Spore coat U domain-containing protein n=1 Tax=Ramlibacter humi TaxID=2530451 RepID=A0A4Z0BGJ2_9BURK|nr:spore coat protein U domain-containing protein [Ramlibacter humi]TFY97028.1 spore coat U domain-containing protein [Ramlibacter humi]
MYPMKNTRGALAAALRLVLLLAGLLLAPQAFAQQCISNGATNVSFGVLSPDRASDSQGTVNLTCQSGFNPGYVRYCVYIGLGSPAGIAPRRMENWFASIAFDLYSDPARTKLIGPPPSGGGFPVYTGTLPVAGGYALSAVNIPIYGRVPSGQSWPDLSGTWTVQHLVFDAQVVWAFDDTKFPDTCTGGIKSSTEQFFWGSYGDINTACRITDATDLDFGVVASLASDTPGASTITVRCPAGTPWTLALSAGGNAILGNRRMKSAAGKYVSYELYKDSGHGQKWGSVAADMVNGTGAGEKSPTVLRVYGLVPAQSSVPGSYSDLITVTLTY